MEAKTSVDLSYQVLKAVGCPCIVLTLVCRSDRPAKIRSAQLRLGGSLFRECLRSYEHAFDADFGHSLPEFAVGESNYLAISFLPASPTNSPHGFVVERDEACKFVLPILGIPITFAEAPSEYVSIAVSFFDESEQIVLRGEVVRREIEGAIRLTMEESYSLNPQIVIDQSIHITQTDVPRYDPKMVNTANPKALAFPRGPNLLLPLDQDVDAQGAQKTEGDPDTKSPAGGSAAGEEKFSVALRGFGRATSPSPFGTGEPFHLAIELTIANLGQAPTFIVAATLRDETGNSSVSFESICHEEKPLSAGARRKGVLRLMIRHSFPPGPGSDRQRKMLRERNVMTFRVLRKICRKGAYFEVATGRGGIHRFPAVEVCDEGFAAWPYLAATEDIIREHGREDIDAPETWRPGSEDRNVPEAFEPFPEIKSLGENRIQALCDEWCRAPQAKEFGLAAVKVAPNCSGLEPVFHLHAQNYKKGDVVHFPFDQIVHFIIDRGIPENAQGPLKERLLTLRQRVGVAVFQRFKINVDSYPLALNCPSCSLLILTQLRVFEDQKVKSLGLKPVTCPRCRFEFDAKSDDLFPVMEPR